MVSIGLYDRSLSPLMDGLVSFEIPDPEVPPGTDNAYGVSVKLVGEDRTNPDHWAFDHVNYWTGPNEPTPIDRSQLDEMLARHQTSFREMLAQFLALLSGNG